MNVEGTDYFSEDAEDGAIEIRYIREYGVCICTKHEGKDYFFPMISMEDKSAFSNVFSDIVSDYDIKLKQIIKGLVEHKDKRNEHNTKLFDLKDLQRTFVDVETEDSDGVGTGIFYKVAAPFVKFDALQFDGEKFIGKRPNHSNHMSVRSFSIAGGTTAGFDFADVNNTGYNTFNIDVTGLGVYTITGISNALAGEKYTFLVKGGSADNVVIKYDASSIRTPRQLDVLLEEYSTATFFAISSGTISCVSFSDNKT